MNKKVRAVAVGVIVFFGLIAITGGSAFMFGKGGLLSAQQNVEDVLQNVVSDRLASELDGEVDFGSDSEINILLIGLDQRKDWDNPHCDAIHLFTLDIEQWDITITSVPRGTYAYIPKDIPAHENYMANTCSYEGIEYGIKQVERLLGVKTDYYATVNFSQTIGILRLFQMPTTESLQYLRHRQSYQIGDPQRSHNQAVFMGDVIKSQGHRLQSDFSLPLFYALYNFVDTDMEFSAVKALVDGYLENGILEREDAITYRMVPYHAVTDMHFDTENPQAQIDALLDRIRPYLSSEDLSDRSLESIQADLLAYLEDGIDTEDTVQDVVNRQLWLQLENEPDRERMHYAYVEEYVYWLVGQDRRPEAIALVSNYIVEKQALGQEDYEDRGKGLLNFIEE